MRRGRRVTQRLGAQSSIDSRTAERQNDRGAGPLAAPGTQSGKFAIELRVAQTGGRPLDRDLHHFSVRVRCSNGRDQRARSQSCATVHVVGASAAALVRLIGRARDRRVPRPCGLHRVHGTDRRHVTVLFGQGLAGRGCALALMPRLPSRRAPDPDRTVSRDPRFDGSAHNPLCPRTAFRRSRDSP